MSIERNDDPHGEGYRGQAYVEGREATGAPPPPTQDDAPAAGEADRERILFGPIGTYAKVEIIGSFGVMCTGKQRIVLHDVTIRQARQTRWDYYGLCSSTMSCYDEQGRVVLEE